VTPLQDVLLGILQGLGEFLPISSSAHLILVPWLLGWAEHSLALDVALHVGTLVAVLAAFFGDWVRLFGGALRGAAKGNPFGNEDGRLLGLLAIASLPGGVAGLLLEKRADTLFRDPALVATVLAVFGVLLYFADRKGDGGKSLSNLSLRDAVLIGLCQSLAVVPGVSRSGITISAALLLSYPREASARFSFLLSTPIILGAAALKVPGLLRHGDRAGVLLGIGASALVGLVAIRFLLSYVRKHSYLPFAAYRILLGLLVLCVAFLRSGHLG
jgi:undecaprenyl-diphosphatase